MQLIVWCIKYHYSQNTGALYTATRGGLFLANRFREALESGEFVITCEMIPGRGANEASQQHEMQVMEEIYATGRVHAISITDNPSGNPAIMADTMARELKAKGIETLTHFTCKDRTRNQVQGQLYALQRDGLENLLFMTGDCQTSGWNGTGRPCFDLDSVTIQMLAAQMNEGLLVQTRKGEIREEQANFFAGGCVNPFKYRTGEIIPQYLKAEKKVIAGAKFLITQLGYDSKKMKELQTYMNSRGFDTPLIANIFLLTRGAAKLMQAGTIAGTYISDELMAKLEEEAQAEDKGRAARIERAAKMIAIAKGMGYAGVHIGGFGLDAAMVLALLDRAEELLPEWEACAEEISYGKPGGDFLYGDGTGSADAPMVPKENIAGRKLFHRYGLSRFFHHWVLTLDKRFCKTLARVMDSRDKKKGIYRAHDIEHGGKAYLYGCIDCGDCGLEAAIYSCPMAMCPKCQRNGPCGGSNDGWCEKYPGERYCIWYKAYHRLDKYDEHWRMRSFITPPNNWEYWQTSAWSSYTHKRDNCANRIPVSIGLDGVQGGVEKK